jgi:hypothetical protein
LGTPKLTKQAILDGTRVRSTITVKEYGADVVIRPLTDGELTKIFGVVGAIPLKADGTPDVAGMDVSKNFEALRLAASMGMEEPKLTVDEVASMKFGVPEDVGMKVLVLSGVSGEGASQKKRR